MKLVILILAIMLSTAANAGGEYIYMGRAIVITDVEPAAIFTEPSDEDLDNSLNRMDTQNIPLNTRLKVIEVITRPSKIPSSVSGIACKSVKVSKTPAKKQQPKRKVIQKADNIGLDEPSVIGFIYQILN
jgi:hypothetical protein